VKQPTSFDKKLTWLFVLATAIPSVLLVVALIVYQASYFLLALTILSLLMLQTWAIFTFRHKINFQLRTLSNLLEAMTHGDYSMRGRRQSNVEQDALNELVGQINELADTLTKQRFIAAESQLLLNKVIHEIKVAIIAINADQQVTLANPEAKKLFAIEDAKELSFVDLNLSTDLLKKQRQLVELTLPKHKGQFEIVVQSFREQGQQHHLLFITDVRLLLRSKEREAWQNLVRVLSHEINNSLAPIASISGTLQNLISKQQLDDELKQDIDDSLGLIKERSQGLTQFIQSYKSVMQIPEPQIQQIDLPEFFNDIMQMFHEQCEFAVDWQLQQIQADPLLLKQVLINIVKNAIEAMPNGGTVSINSSQNQQMAQIQVCDQGSGISNMENLFTPFFTTKPQGSGIGLLFCRQTIEAHQGYFSIDNRKDTMGCCVTIELPLIMM